MIVSLQSNNTMAFHQMKADDVGTIYFALRAYRDQLHQSLVKMVEADLSADDYVCVQHGETIDEPFDLHPLPQVKLSVLLDTNTNYEEAMFLFEQLARVNGALYEIVDNHERPNGTHEKVTGWLNV